MPTDRPYDTCNIYAVVWCLDLFDGTPDSALPTAEFDTVFRFFAELSDAISKMNLIEHNRDVTRLCIIMNIPTF